MKNVIAKNTLEVQVVKKLLAKKVPTYRQAYSDRTAWLMACFAELSYLRFNPLFISTNQQALFSIYIKKFTTKSTIKALKDKYE